MKTLKLFFVVWILSALVGCENEFHMIQPVSTGEVEYGEMSVQVVNEDGMPTKGDVTDYTGVLSEESDPKSIDVLVFDKQTGALNASFSLDAYTDVCNALIPSGEKVVYAVVNSPSVDSVTRLDQMPSLVYDLSVNSFTEDGLALVGSTECEVKSGVKATPKVIVSWLVSRVVLRKIRCELPRQYGKMTVDCVYLGNANTVQTVGGVLSGMVNHDGYVDEAKTVPVDRDHTGMCSEYLFRQGDADINVGSYSAKLYRMYCQPNQSDVHTCVYIAAIIDGTRYYYRIPLENGLTAGSTCSIEVTVSNLGSLLPPDGDLVRGDLTGNISISGWGAGSHYVKEF